MGQLLKVVLATLIGTLLFFNAATPVATQSYRGCAAESDIAVCIANSAYAAEPSEIDRNDLIAVGAFDLLFRHGDGASAQAAAIFAGEAPTVLPDTRVLRRIESLVYANEALPLFRSDTFVRLLELAIEQGSLAPRDAVPLFRIAKEGRHDGTARRLLLAADPALAESSDELAEFAMVAAHFGRLPDLAEAYLEDGGEDAEGYDVPGIRHAIRLARLHDRYDPIIAAQVLAVALDDDHPVGWPSDEMEALSAAGAGDELRTLADARIRRARSPARYNERVTGDLSAAAWLLEAAGDRAGALALALESAGGSTGRSTWGAELAYGMGEHSVVGEGLLAGYPLYSSVLAGSGAPDPFWLASEEHDVDSAIILLTSSCHSAPARALRGMLIGRLASYTEPFDIAWQSNKAMLLAGTGGDRAAVEHDLQRALAALDQMPVDAAWTAVRTAVAYRTALQLLECGTGIGLT